MILDALLDAVLDSLKLLPFLFLTYLFMEWLEHGAGERFEDTVARAGRVGPLIGALLGVVPQCGFSGAAATLYAGRVVTLGTLVAVFLATSDEMLPIMISEAVNPLLIVGILAVKVVAGIAVGFVLDAVLSRSHRLHAGFSTLERHTGHGDNDIHELCEQEGCACEDEHEGEAHGSHIVLPALRHSLNIIVFIFLITFALNIIVDAGLEGALASFTNTPYLSAIVCAVIGFIPNCAVSVAMTQLYLEGLMTGGALLAGLLVNAGIGWLVLFRTNHDVKENLRIMALMFVVGIVTGCIVQFAGWF